MMGNAERALIAYAVLKTQLDQSDLYEGLMIFFRPIAAEKAGQLFVPVEFAEELGTRYGLRVPTLVVESLAERMVKSGLLQRRSQSDGVALYEYANSTLATTNNLSIPHVADLLNQFRQFARTQTAELAEVSDNLLDDALFDRLLRIESLEILSRRDGLESPKYTPNTLTLKSKIVNQSTGTPLERHLDYIVSSFILNLVKQDDEGFTLLSDIATANLAAETLLTYRDPPKRGETFEEIDVFLDAPLCLDILGVNPGREQYGSQFHQELKRSGCRVNVFLHSIIEIERILEARKQSYLSDVKFFGTFIVDPPAVRDLVRALAGRAEDILREQFGFQIIDSAAAIPLGRRAAVGSVEENSIREQLGGWKNAEGREVDISTCCDLIRMRSGNEPETRILKAGSIFVTRNATLARAANATWKTWLKDKKRASTERLKNVAQLAILDKQLVGLIWITQGGQVGALGRAHLVANCAAAVATRKDVITRVYNTLITTSENSARIFSALINDHRAERALMNSTFGDPEVVTDEKAFSLLETVKRATAEEIELEKNAEIAVIQNKLEQQRVSLEERIAQLEKSRDEALHQKLEAQQGATQYREREDKRQRKLVEQAFKEARRIYTTSIIFISLLLGVISYGIQVIFSHYFVFFQTEGVSGAMKFFLPAVISGASGLLLAWDVPELLVGKFRDGIGEKALLYFAKKHHVHPLLEHYSWDFKDGRINKNNSAQDTQSRPIVKLS